MCGQHLLQNRQQIGLELDAGGNIVPKIVEIDESKFSHRKYHRGENREGHWVFGGIERGSNICFIAEVERRDGATLLQLIKDMILPGTHIISDNGAYTHDVINHEDNFVDPNNPDIHTQNIDSMCSRARRMFRQMYGTSIGLFDTYLVEFMWRTTFGRDEPFCAILLNSIHCRYFI